MLIFLVPSRNRLRRLQTGLCDDLACFGCVIPSTSAETRSSAFSWPRFFASLIWGYRTPDEAAAKKKPWINARVEKALTGRYFRHMFREGRVIIPGGGWFEWTLENGKKQPWYIKRKEDESIFMAGLTNFRLYTQLNVEVGFVIFT